MNILLIGSGAREHVIAETFKRNKDANLFAFMKANNPGIASLSEQVVIGRYSDMERIKKFAEDCSIDFAFIGPEDPLNYGVVDALTEMGVDTIGPVRALAKLETSKSYTRKLLKKYDIEGNPKFKVFNKDNLGDVNEFLDELEGIVDIRDGIPMIRVGGSMANRNAVRHELYHIYKGHLNGRHTNKWLKRLDYWFRREPQACLYEITGIKL